MHGVQPQGPTRLAQAVLTGETVTVYGDYDVDWATSAALLIRLLRMLGHDARYYIPDRLLEGYGPSGEALVRLAGEGSSLIVTVDCGAMAHEALAMAHAAGVDVIVVDHHKCAAELPTAAALVNPNRLDENEIGAAHGHLAAVGIRNFQVAQSGNAVGTCRARRPRPAFGTAGGESRSPAPGQAEASRANHQSDFFRRQRLEGHCDGAEERLLL